MTGRGKLIAGPTLILMGILLLAGHSVHWQTFGVLWLFLLLGAGIVLLALFAQGRRHPSILSGGVLITLITLHLMALRWDWVSFDRSWPFFLLAPGLALLAVASSDRGNRDALTPAIVLIGASLFCYAFTLGVFAFLFRLALGVVRFGVKYLLPIMLIGWGVWLLLDGRSSKQPLEREGVPPAPEVPVKVEVEEIEEIVVEEVPPDEISTAEFPAEASEDSEDDESTPRFS